MSETTIGCSDDVRKRFKNDYKRDGESMNDALVRMMDNSPKASQLVTEDEARRIAREEIDKAREEEQYR